MEKISSGIPLPTAVELQTPKGSAGGLKSRIPSPHRRTPGPSSCRVAGNSGSILSTPGVSSLANKFSKALLRPSASPPPQQQLSTQDDKDNDKDQDLVGQRVALNDVGPASSNTQQQPRSRPTSASRLGAIKAPDSGSRLVKQPSTTGLLKSGGTTSPAPSTTSATASKLTPPGASSSKTLPRATSTTRDRAPPGETRSSILRRSMSVGKGRALSSPGEPGPQVSLGAKVRPIFVRTSLTSTASVSGRAVVKRSPEKRDPSAGRLRRPASAAAGKTDTSLVAAASSKPALNTIKEAPARPASAAAAAPATTSAPPKPATPSRPVFSLNLGALKQQPSLSSSAPLLSPPPLLPQVESFNSNISQEDSGPPVPKLDLGGILQRRAEEQAQEPVFVVAEEEPAGPESLQQAQQDKRKSASRQPSAKEEPAEHFYLYPKVLPQEKKKIDDICKVLPKRQQSAVTDLFGKMVEARQNCEQMCFRGHRLLDQAQSEFRNRLAQKEEEVAQKEEEAGQWRQEAEYLRAQLSMMMGSRQPTDNMPNGNSSSATGEQDADADRVAELRDNLFSTFDRMALLAPPTEGPEAGGSDTAQEEADG